MIIILLFVICTYVCTKRFHIIPCLIVTSKVTKKNDLRKYLNEIESGF